jgi:hypothetical protein
MVKYFKKLPTGSLNIVGERDHFVLLIPFGANSQGNYINFPNQNINTGIYG